MDIPATTYRRRKVYRKMHWRDFADHIGLRYCTSGPVGCRNKYDQATHDKGLIDNLGVYHWSGIDRKYHRAQLHKFLFQAAYCLNRPYRNEPEWLGIYHAATWAQRTATYVFKVRLAASYSSPHRRRVRDLAVRQKVGLRWEHTNVWEWTRDLRKREHNRAKM